MDIARIALASVLLFAGCKDKKQPKPAPAQSTQAREAAKPIPTSPDGSAETKPAETKPIEIKPAGGFTTQAEYEAKGNEMLDQMMVVLQQAGTNCDKLTDGINKLVETNKTTIDGAREFKTANPEAEKQLIDKSMPRQREVATKLRPAMQACRMHKGFQAALKKLD